MESRYLIKTYMNEHNRVCRLYEIQNPYYYCLETFRILFVTNRPQFDTRSTRQQPYVQLIPISNKYFDVLKTRREHIRTPFVR